MKKIFLCAFFVLIICNIGFAENLKIIDGDTIILNGEKIRFSGIDTPEPKQICTLDNIEIFCGNLATVVLKEKIGNEIVTCEREKELDKYNRILAECFVKGQSLSSYMVRNGYAFAYRFFSDKFIKDEVYARQNNLGLWVMEFEYPWDYRKRTRVLIIN